MKKVKIRLTTSRGGYEWLAIEWRPKRSGQPREVDQFYLTSEARLASAVPVDEARKWMYKAKSLASFDGISVEKAEYLLNGKPTTLAAARS